VHCGKILVLCVSLPAVLDGCTAALAMLQVVAKCIVHSLQVEAYSVMSGLCQQQNILIESSSEP
jgi:hypothetical protein